MFRCLCYYRITPALTIPFFANRSKFDIIEEENKKIVPQTGWERVQKIFLPNEYDERSVELHSIVQSGLIGCLAGAGYGGFVRAREAYLYFIETNQATIYRTTGEAKKKLQDYVTIAFAKGATTWAWRMGLFSGMFSLVATVMTEYRGEPSVIDYTIGGIVTGGLYRANLGLAAACVGAGLAGVLSTIGGILVIGILHLSGASMDDIRKAMGLLKESRENQMRMARATMCPIKTDEHAIEHEMLLQKKGETTIENI